MEKIKEYVEELMLIKEFKEQELDKSYYTVKYSINIDEVTNRRLQYVANELGITRAEFSRDLIDMALAEVEKQLNLDAYDFETAYSKAIYGDMEHVPVPDSSGKTFMSIPRADFIRMVKESRGNK
ncbi:hypothetical protein [Schinkia azotoformans]|uniref:hypothetical protein n=1 Tax=Schinkia azotoformans TaxID=1454 RepID=UPI002DC03F52|nr:hypothetical protein [Schinkia azotoformans]MEC1746785.1 hypothetical protein [Schinkia azotoformans]